MGGGIDVTQFGVFGIVVVLLVTALVWVVNEWQKDRQRAREYQERVLPALTQATATMADFARVAAVLLDRHERE